MYVLSEYFILIYLSADQWIFLIVEFENYFLEYVLMNFLMLNIFEWCVLVSIKFPWCPTHVSHSLLVSFCSINGCFGLSLWIYPLYLIYFGQMWRPWHIATPFFNSCEFTKTTILYSFFLSLCLIYCRLQSMCTCVGMLPSAGLHWILKLF